MGREEKRTSTYGKNKDDDDDEEQIKEVIRRMKTHNLHKSLWKAMMPLAKQRRSGVFVRGGGLEVAFQAPLWQQSLGLGIPGRDISLSRSLVRQFIFKLNRNKILQHHIMGAHAHNKSPNKF